MSRLVLILILAASMPVSAQDGSDARELFETGMAHADGERWVVALEAFRASLEIEERPVTLYNVAAVLLRLGRHQEAIRNLDRLLEIAESDDDRINAVQMRQDAQRALRTLEVRIQPSFAAISIDGEPVDGRGESREIILDPGSHRLDARADGHADESVELGPEQTRAEITLRTLPATVHIRSDVAGSTVVVDGVERGVDDVQLQLSPGHHRVEVRADGRETFQRSIELGPGERLDVDASLSDRRIWRSPAFWGITMGVVAALGATTGVLIWNSRQTEPPNGGSANFIFRP